MLNLPSEKIRRWLFLLFLFLLALGTRKIFNFQEIENFPGFRENFSFSLFLFELPLLVGFFYEVFLFLFEKKIHKEKISFQEKLLIAFLFLIFSSLFFHPSTQTLYASWRLIEAVGLSFWTKKIIHFSKENFSSALMVLFGTGIFQSVLAFFQFFYQKSLGLYWLGESHLGSQILGVAKLELENQKFIRAYGTFPHPNLLGTFLLLSLASGLWLFFTSSNKKSRQIYLAGFFCLLLGIFLSFSRSVWLATFLFLLIISILKFPSILHLRLTNWFFPLFFFFGLFFFFQPFLASRLCLNCQGDQSIFLREKYSLIAQKIILQNPLKGIGLGNFALKLPHVDQSLSFSPWEIQPVHNLFLLASAELGLSVLIFFLGLLLSTIISFRKNNPLFPLLFLIFLFLGFFDHFFWTLPQGELIFFLVLAFSAYSCKMEKENYEFSKIVN